MYMLEDFFPEKSMDFDTKMLFGQQNFKTGMAQLVG
jgi:hypothetical protein